MRGLERLPVHPASFVLFGATGDLSQRKLMPAVYNLAHDGSLPQRFNLLGVSAGALSAEGFRDMFAYSVHRFSRRAPDEQVLARLLERVSYVSGDFRDSHTYDSVHAALHVWDDEAGEALNRCFYLATAPAFFPLIAHTLGEHGLHVRSGAEVRLIVEKPFGTSLDEARRLNREITSVFPEDRVFRIDHYLGKETVQNLLALRFANQIFEPVWNRNYVEHVQITAAEDVGVGGRADYYDSTGAVRDLVQNHLLQILSLVAMEPPVKIRADDVRNEKVKVLHAIDPPALEDIPSVAVRAQYAAGVVGGRKVPGYLEEPGVPPHSTTETYAALRLCVDNWRWKGVPFYLRTGKRLARKLTEIAVTLKRIPHVTFDEDGSLGIRPNELVLGVEPNEGVSLSLTAKIPGPRMALRPVQMQFLYGTSFLTQSPDAYERLLLDAMRGDATLFTRADEVEAEWRLCDPIVSAWSQSGGPVPKYAAGSQGPAEAESILRNGHAWRRL
ncbi:MAG TPA: glucose-6-phosphate dehydrogenase [Methylomirabilota bacterium]